MIPVVCEGNVPLAIEEKGTALLQRVCRERCDKDFMGFHFIV
jgi:hypothetical protein